MKRIHTCFSGTTHNFDKSIQCDSLIVLSVTLASSMAASLGGPLSK
ncbi:MAG: hypothetical protein KAJ72_08265 [Candidatus Heimdallarchaeota archaeon]|nr:hypothetical protein [Candidatus Heimdallarchaeota archaeon]